MNWKNLALVSTTTIAVLALLFTSLLATGALITSTTVSASGVIATANLGVYSDSACTQRIASINWGNLSPGSAVTRTVYLKNVGTTAITLGLTNTNWNPTTANGPITLTWDRQNTALAANQVITATLRLGVSSTISGVSSFNMNIVITGNA